MNVRTDRPNYLLAPPEVAVEYQTDLERGLSDGEAARRLREIGPNVFQRREHYFLRALARRVFNALTLILLLAIVISVFTGGTSDAVLIGIVVLVDITVGLLYESYSRYKIDLIRKQVPRLAEVVRTGHPRLVPVEEVVPGDLIVFRQGERVPADTRLTRVAGLRVDESVLTGEPGDLSKVPWALNAEAATADQRNMVFAGTIITTGHGQGIAVATGIRSVIGSLARRVVEAGWQVTPLEQRLRSLGQFVAVGILCVGALLFTLGIMRGGSTTEMFRFSLTLSVAAIPEDLTLILTVALAVGATRLAKHRVLVRHLTAAETLGDATVVATDKTGTLTTGQLILRRVDGMSESWGQPVFRHVARHPLFRRSVIGAIAGTEVGTAEEAPRGSSLERAVREAVTAAGIPPALIRKELPLFSSIAFDPRYRYHASLHDDPLSPDPVLFAVGAPEVLLSQCVAVSDGRKSVPLSEPVREQLLERVAAEAASGTRVLVVCTRHLPRHVRTLAHKDVKRLTFLALLFFDDPLRKDAAAAVRDLQRAGVRVVLITGDHRETSSAIARATGILRKAPEGILEGARIEHLADASVADALLDAGVVARADPLQKERLVVALQERGEIVAMVGDGVNDAVALRRADLGVAVATATDVAKDASDLVLVDSGLSTLNVAVWEGRRIRETVRAVLAFLFSTNLTEILIVAGTLLLGIPLPFLPAQLLWINVVTDGMADFALVLEPASTRAGDLKPGRKRSIFGIRDLVSILFAAGAFLIPTLVAYTSLFDPQTDLARARTAAFVTLAASQLFGAFSYRSLERPAFRQPPWKNPWLLLAEFVSFALLIAAVQWEPLAQLLGTQSLAFHQWVAALALALVGFFLADLRKVIIPRFFSPKPGDERAERLPVPLAPPRPAT